MEHLLDAALARTKLQSADRHLCQELVYGIVRWQATLDWLIDRKATSGVKQTGLRILLQVGLYQLLWLDRVPPHAAVNETVELARHTGFGAQSGFVNAILRGYARELDETRRLLQGLKATEPPLGYSHPGWLANRWAERWGQAQAAQLMEWNNTPPKLYARINTLKTDAEKLLPLWREEDVEYDFVRHPWLEENLVFELKSHPSLDSLPSFNQGLFYVQDPSTLLAPRELDPQPEEKTLDMCAAPGGKLTYLAQLTGNAGQLVAYDLNPERLKQVTENCARLGVASATANSLADLDKEGPFDRILVDAPCSNTGVIRRRVDLRWRIRPEEIERLTRTQIELLDQAAARVKPGGRIVYSTCSLEQEENRRVADAFLASHPGFELRHERELTPFTDQVDGAYVAVLIAPTKR